MDLLVSPNHTRSALSLVPDWHCGHEATGKLVELALRKGLNPFFVFSLQWGPLVACKDMKLSGRLDNKTLTVMTLPIFNSLI